MGYEGNGVWGCESCKLMVRRGKGSLLHYWRLSLPVDVGDDEPCWGKVPVGTLLVFDGKKT